MPKLLDLFSGAGGSAMGYHRAGFEVTGVDISPQPHYPFKFIQADALTFPLEDFDVIHASPPCQFGTAYKHRSDHVYNSPNLIPAMRSRLIGHPYVIENLWTNRAHLISPICLCGSSFSLDVQRHRAFESNYPLTSLPCQHASQLSRFPPASNRKNLRRTVEIGVWRIPLSTQQAAMGIDWMNLEELSQAIPPAYTEYIGKQLISQLHLL